MWGIIPAAGKGSRIQPLAFSKELLPLSALDGENVRRPRAVSDFLVQRLLLAGARRICFVIAPDKSDILEYYSRFQPDAAICYVVQPHPAGLCDAIFQALPVIDRDEPVLIGLPDTIWFPEDGLKQLPDDRFSFLLFPVSDPWSFDAVQLDDQSRILNIFVKDPHPPTNLIWGAFKMPGSVLHELFELWIERGRTDEYIGTLVNEWLARGGSAWGVAAGHTYYDVGTMEGYLKAMRNLSEGIGVAAGQPVA